MAKAQVQAGAWDPAVEVAVVVAVMEQVRVETAFVQTDKQPKYLRVKCPKCGAAMTRGQRIMFEI